MRRAHVLAAAMLVGAAAIDATAVDHPVAGDRLLLKDTGSALERRVKFRAARDAAVMPSMLGDPTVLGATLEVDGAGLTDGTTGPLALGAGFWAGLGNPPGTRGYKFVDPARTVGVKRVLVKAGTAGGTITVVGGGAAWPYAVTQPQAGPIDVRLSIGTDVLCARFSTFTINAGGKVKATGAMAPGDCSPPPPPSCGNGVAEGTEECDDGDTDGGDGCSPGCLLENTSAICAGVPATNGSGLDSFLFASGLDQPVFVTAPRLDPNRVFILEQEGRIRIVQNGTLLGTPFLDVTALVSCCGERGLLGLAFHPQYEANGLFFVNYTNNAGNTVIARYQVSGDPNVANAGSALVLLTIPQDFSNHNGGTVAFGPDGFLYVGMGDGGSGGDPNERAQDPAQLLGKMLRLDVDQAGPPWAAAGNPFNDGGLTLPLDEIWSIGWRNPWRFSFDRANGDLYVGDVGQDNWEEISYEPSGSPGGLNYGWDVFEGDGHCFEGDPGCSTPANYVMPVL